MSALVLPPPLEAVTSLRPFRLRRQVRWSECDPAGVVYAGRFVDYMLAACHQFRSHVLGASLALSPEECGYGAPGKGLEIEYQASLWPDQVFEMTVFVGAIGTRTTHMLVQAEDCNTGAPVFRGRVSSIYIPANDRSRAIPVPAALRERLAQYQCDCGLLPPGLERVLP